MTIYLISLKSVNLICNFFSKLMVIAVKFYFEKFCLQIMHFERWRECNPFRSRSLFQLIHNLTEKCFETCFFLVFKFRGDENNRINNKIGAEYEWQ